MANQEHLDILLQGVEQWNRWREQQPEKAIDLSDVNFTRVDLTRANLSNANLSGANFTRADLDGANFTRANLSNADLISADLGIADLSNAKVNGATLINATLIDANLSRATLIDANFSNANLSGANFTRANLSGTNFRRALIGSTFFGDRDLREMKGLETVRHIGPSPLSINTIYLSEGNIPEVFVRGTGAPDNFIEYMRSLANKPIQFYSCFISYSSKDQDFAERIYADFQTKGVRCWFAPHHMKTGDPIRERIDESIRLHDKLLLILSQNSVRSSWVETEVEKAFDKERRQKKKNVLFPIILDDSVTRSRKAWATEIQKTRHITDFTDWKQHDDYQKALKKLLDDLQAGE